MALCTDPPAELSIATHDQRNNLPYQRVEWIAVESKTVVACSPRPVYACLFVLDFEERLKVLSGGSDGIRTRDLSLDRAAC